MSEIAIVVDSTADIPEDLIKNHNIPVIPHILRWGGENLLDGVDINPDEFYKRLQSTSEFPATSQPSAGEFAEFFKNVSENAESILAILISDHLSSTLDSAQSAADMLNDIPINIIDSRSTSMGLGFIVLAAAKAVESGYSFEDVTKLAQDLVPKARIKFVVDTLEYLHRGGRIGGAERLMGTMLSLKPLLHLEDGRIEPLATFRTKRKAIAQMLAVIGDEIKDMKTVHMATVNAMALKEASEIGEQLQERFNPVELLHVNMSPVIGTHVGPGTVGVSYLVED